MVKYGVDLGHRTWLAFLNKIGWMKEQVDKVICHQVGSVHHDLILKTLGTAARKGLFDLPLSRQHRHGVAALDGRAGGGARLPAHRRPRRFPGPRQRPELPDARDRVVTDLYPFQGHFLDLNGLRYHYLDEGHGEPVVMLHGNPTWSFYYRRLVLALRDSCRTIVPDHIGCGLSDKPDDSHYRYTLEQRVRDLEMLLDHLAITRDVTLVLHDWGGMIGMAYATRHPERIRRLVILNTAAFHLPAAKPLPWSLWLCRNTALGAFLVRGPNLFCRMATFACCRRRRMPRPLRRAYIAPYNSWANRIAVLRFVQDIPLRPGDPSYDLVSAVQDGLHRLRNVPMLICWGEKDFVFDRHFLAEWQRRFPAAEVHRIADKGARATPVVNPKSRIRHFLDLGQQHAGADRVDRTGLDQDAVARSRLDTVEQLFDLSPSESPPGIRPGRRPASSRRRSHFPARLPG